MTPKNAITFSLFAVSLFSFCHKSGSPSDGTTVYTAGEWGNLRYDVAAYWVNGRLVSLTDTFHVAFARSICVSGKDVYVAGMISNPGSPNSDEAVYWKNGQAFTLGTASPYAIANSIVVANGNVYTAGNDGSSPAFWVNGRETRLNGASFGANIPSMAISGTDVYVVGADTLRNPCFWKNGQLIELQGAWSSATAIAVSGNDIYIAGQQSDTITNNRKAILWKNGVPTPLSDGSEDVIVDGIYIAGEDVYVCGNTQGALGYTSTIWKNGQVLPVQTSASTRLYAWGVAAVNGAVYIGGNASVPGQTIAAYWSAAGIVEMDQDPAKSSNVWGIFVQ